MIFQLIAVILLGIFYSCYFGKMIAQRRKGIQTDQIGKGKTGTEKVIELTMKAATLSVPVLELISICMDTRGLPEWARCIVIVLAISGDMVFVISVWTMKDSWRAGVSKTDQTELVTDGIYQISRNPAFLGFDLVYVGILNRDTLSFILNQKVVVRSLKQMIERQPRFLDTHCNSFTMSVSFRVIMFWKCRLGEIIEIEKRYGK